MRVEEEIGPERDPEGEEIDWGTLWAGYGPGLVDGRIWARAYTTGKKC